MHPDVKEEPLSLSLSPFGESTKVAKLNLNTILCCKEKNFDYYYKVMICQIKISVRTQFCFINILYYVLPIQQSASVVYTLIKRNFFSLVEKEAQRSEV